VGGFTYIYVWAFRRTARCAGNGELLEAAMPVPTGSRRLGLEADSGTMEYRHIELKLLP